MCDRCPVTTGTELPRPGRKVGHTSQSQSETEQPSHYKICNMTMVGRTGLEPVTPCVSSTLGPSPLVRRSPYSLINQCAVSTIVHRHLPEFVVVAYTVAYIRSLVKGSKEAAFEIPLKLAHFNCSSAPIYPRSCTFRAYAIKNRSSPIETSTRSSPPTASTYLRRVSS